VIEQLKKETQLAPASAAPVSKDVLESGFSVFRRTFDTRRGGLAARPNFRARLLTTSCCVIIPARRTRKRSTWWSRHLRAMTKEV